MNLETLKKFVGKSVQVTIRKNKKDFPVIGKLVLTRQIFNRDEGFVEIAGKSKWFIADKISEIKKV